MKATNPLPSAITLARIVANFQTVYGRWMAHQNPLPEANFAQDVDAEPQSQPLVGGLMAPASAQAKAQSVVWRGALAWGCKASRSDCLKAASTSPPSSCMMLSLNTDWKNCSGVVWGMFFFR